MKQEIIVVCMWLGVINMLFLLFFWNNDYHAGFYIFDEADQAYRFTPS